MKIPGRLMGSCFEFLICKYWDFGILECDFFDDRHGNGMNNLD